MRIYTKNKYKVTCKKKEKNVYGLSLPVPYQKLIIDVNSEKASDGVKNRKNARSRYGTKKNKK